MTDTERTGALGYYRKHSPPPVCLPCPGSPENFPILGNGAFGKTWSLVIQSFHKRTLLPPLYVSLGLMPRSNHLKNSAFLPFVFSRHYFKFFGVHQLAKQTQRIPALPERGEKKKRQGERAREPDKRVICHIGWAGSGLQFSPGGQGRPH